MTDLIGIGASGVRAYQAALGAVADNVANADTPGYVRRTVTLRSSPTAGAGEPLVRGVSIGSGVAAGAVQRADDALLAAGARNAAGDAARLTARAEWLDRLQIVAGGEAGLAARIGSFFDAATELSADPASIAARTIFLARADQTAAQFRSVGADLRALAGDLDTAVAAGVREVNDLSASLAQVNEQLRRTPTGGAAANSLLDRRDTMLADLGKLVRIAVREGPRGAVEVRIGEGPGAPLLVGTAGATRIAVSEGPAGPMAVLDPTHAATPVRLPASGRLAGLLEAARQTAGARDAIGAVAAQFGAAVNAQHAAGADLTGAAGQPLFATTGLRQAPGAANGGSAALGVDIADLGTVDASGYTMRWLGGQWTLARGDATASVAGTGPLTLDGVTVNPTGVPAEGDGWQLLPLTGAEGLRLRPLDPANVAAADRWFADAAAGNSGTGRIAVRFDAAAAALPPLPSYGVVVTGPGQADILDPATGTVLASVPIGMGWMPGAGFDFDLGGAPAVGDSFRIVAAAPRSADNGNLLGLVALRQFAGNGGSFEEALDAAAAGISTGLSETRRMEAAASAVAEDAARAMDVRSGVDLDREAAELTRLQAAYRASAQVIAAARDLFDALLQTAA